MAASPLHKKTFVTTTLWQQKSTLSTPDLFQERVGQGKLYVSNTEHFFFLFWNNSKLLTCPLVVNQGLPNIPDDQLECLPAFKTPTLKESLPIKDCLSFPSFYFL